MPKRRRPPAPTLPMPCRKRVSASFSHRAKEESSMYDREPLDFSVLDVNTAGAALDDVRTLLGDGGLGMDADIRQFVVARSGKRTVGCAGIAGNVIKCVAVAADSRGDNLSARLLAEVEILAVRQGHFHLFLYTRPANIDVFRGCGFYPLAQ